MNSLLKLINEKRAHLMCYEVFSYQLLSADMDEINSILDQRESIIISINKVDKRINEFIELSEFKHHLQDCKEKKMNREEIHPYLYEICDSFQSIQDSLIKIQSIEIKINERMEMLKNELHSNLVQVENVSKIKKYFETYETEMQDMNQMMRKSTKI